MVIEQVYWVYLELELNQNAIHVCVKVIAFIMENLTGSKVFNMSYPQNRFLFKSVIQAVLSLPFINPAMVSVVYLYCIVKVIMNLNKSCCRENEIIFPILKSIHLVWMYVTI